MSAMTKASYEMDAEERRRLDRDGYVVREGVFSASECAVIAAECEAMVDALVAHKAGTEKLAVGSYMFQRADDLETTVKWEPFAPDLVQGIEPFAHYWKPLKDWGMDARMTEPCKAITGSDEVVLFTEKLNLKRARQGGAIILHQDFPYWETWAPQAPRVATAMIFLDDSTIENGCLEVAPGTHKQGKWPQRTDADAFGSLEMDPAQFDMSRLIPLEVKAGTVAFFGAFLVHRSLPNTSAVDRRALLYSYQPSEYPHAREMMSWRRRQQAAAAAKTNGEP
jgi:hypothetical protein